MGFIDEVRDEQSGRTGGGNRCLMCETIEDWRAGRGGGNQRDADDLAEALADRTVFASTLISVLKRRGVTVSDNQVGNHRRRHVEGWRP